ncbi:hypothetical protein KAT36_01155 [Candidatus Pacearchaeota archaeon]|nr:hypothetical protein [Candidatus Pacearchaeota archaeon]
MDLKKIVLSSVNTFEEIDVLREELNKLPRDYQPFPNLENRRRIGAILFGEGVLLSPMVGKNNTYNGTIRHPDNSSEGKSVLSGAQFKYKRKTFVLYRTESKHNNL